jgi:uncharacterized membrane protein
MQSLSSLSPALIIHLFAALGALVLGPLALWARLLGRQRPRLHRAFGYAWVTLMIITAVSALFISSVFSWNWAGFSFIHLLIPVTLLSLVASFWALARGNIRAHRYGMISLYVNACLIAGAFTLLPGRFLGQVVWHQWLGWI